MTSQSPTGWRRLPSKTHGTFETIPSLRVASKDVRVGKSSASVSSFKSSVPKKPTAHYADPLRFPGRRLDRRQPSNYSGVSGHSGLSGLDQLTLNSSGRARGPASTAGSTKLSHTSLPTLHRPFLPDGADPWSSARQVRAESPLTIFKRQVEVAEEATRVAAAASALPTQSSLSKVSRWQQANFAPQATFDLSTKPPLPPPAEHREPLDSPVDSLESRESELEPPVDQELLLQQQLRRQEQQQRELRQQREMQRKQRGRRTPPPVVHVNPPMSGQPVTGLRHVNPHRRPAETPAVSPNVAPADNALQLNKILWALAPDEHANTSEAGQSIHQQTTATGDQALNNTARYVTLTDLDGGGSDDTRHVPDTTRNPQLTEQLLSDHTQSWSRDDRIFQWLSECDQETTSQSLPTHLPDIKYTFKYLKSAT